MKFIYKIILTLAFSASIVLALFLLQEKPAKNGFKRGKVYTAKKLNELELKYHHFYISHISNNRIYLGNTKALLLLFSCKHNLQDSVYERLTAADERPRGLEVLKQMVLQQIGPDGDRFSTDGYLSYNENTGRMVYTYYYRNAFVFLDTALNVLHRGKLIDTNTLAKIQPGAYEAAGKRVSTMAKPPLVVNKRGYIDAGWFYNHAALPADNESLQQFSTHEVLDVYAAGNGQYSHSIYLPKYQGRKLTGFAVHGSTLFALYGKYLIAFNLSVEREGPGLMPGLH